MRILSVSAQRPDSTGSGVYLTELVRGFDDLGQEQAVLAGVGPEDVSPFPENVAFFPVRYESAEMPFPICGMSDEMPYRSTRYRDMTQVMTAQFRAAFSADAWIVSPTTTFVVALAATFPAWLAGPA